MKLLRTSPLWRRALRLLGRQLIRLAENNDESDLERNGETWLLSALLRAHARGGEQRPFVAFDAGGNVGDYTHQVLRAGRAAGCAVQVHVFEPSPRCTAELRQRFATESAVRITSAALADHAGEAALHDGRGGSGQASLVPRDILSGDVTADVTVALVRLDAYLTGNGITRIDLLKLDIEGSELAALRGLGAQLRPELVPVIQFEYGGATLDAGASLRDFYNLFTARGYVVAKLFPTALEVRSYRPWMEHFTFANYVALPAHWLSPQGGTP